MLSGNAWLNRQRLSAYYVWISCDPARSPNLENEREAHVVFGA